MVNYANACVYKLYNVHTGQVLCIGKTVQKLSVRLYQIRRNCVDRPNSYFGTILNINNCGLNDIRIAALELYPCENAKQLRTCKQKWWTRFLRSEERRVGKECRL